MPPAAAGDPLGAPQSQLAVSPAAPPARRFRRLIKAVRPLRFSGADNGLQRMELEG